MFLLQTNLQLIILLSICSSIIKKLSPIIGLKWTLRGIEHLSGDRACVIVANHQSSLDILGISGKYKKKMFFLFLNNFTVQFKISGTW